MAHIKDYYKILDLSPQANPKEIKRNFRRLALRYHPDVNPGNKYAHAWYHEIKEAYDTLSDSDLRRLYLQQRWLLKSQGRKYENNVPVTPEYILKNIVRLDEQIDQMDHFRMGHIQVQKELLNILPDEHIEALLSYGEIATNQLVVQTMLHALEPLEFDLVHPVLLQLKKLEKHDELIQKMIYKYQQQRKRQHTWDKYQVLVIFLASLLLCAIIYYLSS